MHKKQYGFITVFYDTDEDGKKVIKKLRFIGNSKDEYGVDGNIELEENDNGKIDTFNEIIALLKNLPEGSNLKQIIDAIDMKTLTEEEKAKLEELAQAEIVTPEQARDMVAQAIAEAESHHNDGEHGAEQDVNGDEADPDDDI